MLIIGRNVILDTLNNNPGSIEQIYILKGLTDNKINNIRKTAKQLKISVKELNKTEFDVLFNVKNKSEGISQGIAATSKEFRYKELGEIMSISVNRSKSIILILDEIQDPHNLGAIIRTSSAAGIDGIVLTEKNSAKVNHTVFKTSAGTVNNMNIVLSANIYETIDELKKADYKIIGTDLKANSDLFQYKFPDKTCIVLGNEGTGLRTNIKNLCDDNIKIPLNSKVDSLNVSVSAGIILYEIYRQHHN